MQFLVFWPAAAHAHHSRIFHAWISGMTSLGVYIRSRKECSCFVSFLTKHYTTCLQACDSLYHTGWGDKPATAPGLTQNSTLCRSPGLWGGCPHTDPVPGWQLRRASDEHAVSAWWARWSAGGNGDLLPSPSPCTLQCTHTSVLTGPLAHGGKSHLAPSRGCFGKPGWLI